MKFMLLVIYGLAVFFCPNTPWLLVAVPINVAAAVGLRANPRLVLTRTLKFLPFVLLMLIFNLWLDEPANAWWISLKLLLVCNATMIYAATTSVLELAESASRLCRPLKFLGVRPEDIKILVAVAMSMIPVLQKNLRETKMACRAKHIPLNLANAKIIATKACGDALRNVDQIEAALIAKGVSGDLT